MGTQQSIQALNVAGATLLVQLLLLVTFAVTATLDKLNQFSEPGPLPRALGGRADPFAPAPPRIAPILLLALVSFAVLLVCEEFYGVWSPMFGGGAMNTISTLTAINIVFVLDLAVVAYLIGLSGGSQVSPFTGALFTLPALAIFLRIPPSAFVTYAILAALLYLVLLLPGFAATAKNRRAAAFMNISCLMISMFTGYITRPVAIDQLTSLQPSASMQPPAGGRVVKQ